jgi:N-methylhydantoinase B
MTKPEHRHEDFDPIALQIQWARLISLMDEVDAALVRTAFSTIVGETRDFGVVLLNADARSIAQSQLSSPAFTCSLPQATRTMLQSFPAASLRDGDVLITNDPWICHGHLPDFYVVVPVVWRGSIVAYLAAAAHVSDVGGRLDEFDARDVFEEGLRIPPSLLYQAGRRNDTLYRMIEANVRYPRLVLGDVEAILGAFRLGAERVQDIIGDYGPDAVQDIGRGILERSERAMRNAIGQVPDGTYASTVVVDGYRGHTTIRAQVDVRGDALHVDFAGSSLQRTDASVNCVMNVTYAHTIYPLKCALLPHLPNNEGLFRPVTATAPVGSILNAAFPAPVKARSKTSYHIHNAIYGALAHAIPEQVQAGSGSFWSIKLFGSDDHGESFAIHVLPNGGKGAVAGSDGHPTIAFPGNGTITPVEVIENGCPIVVLERSLRTDSGGAGTYRGGPGQVIRFRNDGHRAVRVSIRPDKVSFPAPGIRGGLPGAAGLLSIDGKPLPLEPFVLEYGAVVSLALPGGGGYGDPRARDEGAVAHDVAMGVVSDEAARSIYGRSSLRSVR